MTVISVADPNGPEREHNDPVREAQASPVLSGLLNDHPSAAGELKAAVRAHVHLQELQQRASRAAAAAREAEERAESLTTKLDPAGHRFLGFAAGAALVTLLILLDGVPLNWAAQAFGLNAAGSLLVTGILLVASAGAMVAIELTRSESRRRIVLATLFTAYLALVVLRTEYLITVSAEALPAAVLQSVLLSAISAGLVLCGSAVIARTRQLSLGRARAAARRARDAAAAAEAARQAASDRLHRHFGALRQMQVAWAAGSGTPDGVDHAAWAATLDRAVRAFFPDSDHG
jgi:hypothetical protein